MSNEMKNSWLDQSNNNNSKNITNKLDSYMVNYTL